MKSYLIHLIRHGIAEGNLQGRYIGTTDSPLAPQGIEQLRRQKEAGGYPGAEVYYTSPLRRCVQTLRILYPDASPVVVEGLRECDFGDWEGKTAKELEHDETFLRWMEGKEKVSPPNGESSPVFMHRVCAAFEKLVEGMLRSGTTSAVVVTHGGAIMTLLSAYGLPRAKFYDWMTDNGCGYTLRIIPGLWMRSMVAEVVSTIPPSDGPNREHTVIDLARGAADRAYGDQKPENNA